MAVVGEYQSLNFFVKIVCDDATLILSSIIFDNSSGVDRTITIQNENQSFSYTMIHGSNGAAMIEPEEFVGVRVETEQEGTVVTSGTNIVRVT